MATIDDPKDWKIDVATGDLVIPIVYVRGVEAVAQGIRFRVNLYLGEWAFDLDKGVPWIPRPGIVDERAAILGQAFDDARARAEIRRAILDTPDVAQIDALSVSFDGETRELAITGSVTTTFGRLAIDEEILL